MTSLERQQSDECRARVKGLTDKERCVLPSGHNSPHKNAAGDLTWEPGYVAKMRSALERIGDPEGVAEADAYEWAVWAHDLAADTMKEVTSL